MLKNNLINTEILIPQKLFKLNSVFAQFPKLSGVGTL